MFVCHCAGITDKDIDRAIRWMRAADPHALITRGKIYRALGKRPSCGDCTSLFMDTMERSEQLPIPDLGKHRVSPKKLKT